VIYGLTRAGARQGDTVVVQGAGGLGLNAVAVAREMGADRVIVLDRIAARLELARAFGADQALSLAELDTPEKRIQAVMDLTGGFGADVVADFVGYPEVVPEGLKMLRGGGCYLEVGSIAPGNVFSYDATALVRGNTRLVATSNYSPWALQQALAFLRRNVGRLPFAHLVSHVYPLARITDAFREADWLQRGGEGLRISRAALSMAE
jgi:threonine dehydrogenase-like Zn-dependent dehydrogenase